MVFSASAVPAEEKFGSPYYFLIRQGCLDTFGVDGHVVGDAHRLSHLPPSPLCLWRTVRLYSAAGGRFLYGSEPQHPPLDSAGVPLFSAIGTDQTGPGHLHRLSAGKGGGPGERLASHPPSLFDPAGCGSGSDRGRAGSGDLHRHWGGGICPAVLRRPAAYLCAGRRAVGHTAPVLPGLFLRVPAGACACISGSLERFPWDRDFRSCSP